MSKFEYMREILLLIYITLFYFILFCRFVCWGASNAICMCVNIFLKGNVEVIAGLNYIIFKVEKK